MSCLFCKIVAGEIPASKVYEDDRLIAFNDINPQAPMHVLVVPKQHVATLNDLSAAEDGLVGAMVRTAAAIAKQRAKESLQLSIYALACRDQLGHGLPEAVTLYFTESDQRMSTSRTDEQLDAERAKIVALVSEIRTGNFAANPKADCRYCDFKTICADRRDTGW